MTKDVENITPSFLSRWAKRKADAQADVLISEAESQASSNSNPNTGEPFEAKMLEENQPERRLPLAEDDSAAAAATINPPLPAIESLNNESDFTPFMGKDVASELRNRAMKKLFTDPHYNVMDGLDIYIDDYTKSDPIPLEMLRKMTQSKALFLFEEEEKAEAEAAAALAADLAADSARADENISEAVMPTTVAASPTDDDPFTDHVSLDNSQSTPAGSLMGTPRGVTDASIKNA